MYRDEDIVDIKLNINSIIEKSHNEYKSSYEPTLQEVSNIYQLITKYVIRKNRISYGGFAQNMLLMNKNKDDSFYKIVNGAFYNWPDIADIEMYSPTPIQDAIDLTEELHKAGFHNIDAKEGVHPSTIKIFANFLNYCDISYLPEQIYNNLPTITVNNIRCAHPHFMACDAYRILNDPMTSYWRLDKAIYRFNKLLKYYPIGNNNSNKLHFDTSDHDKMKFVRKNIIHSSKLIVIGFYCYDYYIRKVNKEPAREYNYYEVISSDLVNDCRKIEKLLKLKYKDIRVKQYNPFIAFLDKKIEFYVNNKLIIRVYGNNNRCTVYKYSKNKKTYFGTYNLLYMYLLFNYFYYTISKNIFEKERCLTLLSELSHARNTYLTSHNITVIDKSPFEDFTFKCIGVPVDPIRQSRLNYKKTSRKFNYKPSGKKVNAPKINFDNILGSEIINKNNFFY